MTRRSHHRSHRHHGSQRPGIFESISMRFGVSKCVVIAGFIIGWIFLPVLTTLVFLFALYWRRHPEESERFVDRTIQKGRRLFASVFGKSHQAAHAAAGAAHAEPEQYSDFEFRELRRKFEDLESRAADMENHVASEEYELNRAFKEMRDEKKSED